MRPVTSRLLKQLDASIAAARTPLAVDCLEAERACYLARQGHLIEAKATITRLRRQYLGAPNVEMSAWLSLAEGLESYFGNLGAASHDKILRAHALSAAAGLVTMQALSAAWLSQMDFTKLDAENLARHAKQALTLAGPQDHSARSRVSLVLAQALHVAGRLDIALPWYRRAHFHATAHGDDATISALIHNMACMRLDNLRQVKLAGVGDAIDGDLVLSGAQSTDNFDQLIGASSMKALKPLLRARILSLQGQPAEALILYEEHIAVDVDKGFARMQSDLLSDVAWCHFQIDQRESALYSARAAESTLSAETQIDDRAATHTRLGWLYRELGDFEEAQRHEVLASQAWSTYIQLQARFVALLGSVSENG